jgi:hypothetical protein
MKIAGKKIEGLNIEEIIIPRGNGDDIILKAEAIATFEEFDGLCPRPKPRIGKNRQGETIQMTNEPSHITAMNQYAERRVQYMVIKSLMATPEFEWETIELDKPDTWKNYQTELVASGFSDGEIARILTSVMSASGLDEAKVEAARKRFLAIRQEELLERTSQKDEHNSMLSGDPV